MPSWCPPLIMRTPSWPNERAHALTHTRPHARTRDTSPVLGTSTALSRFPCFPP
jgi:hypothetical protein